MIDSRDFIGIKHEWSKGWSVVLKDFSSLEIDHKVVDSLLREVFILRQYGNKDCTAMADEVLDKERGK